VLRFSDLTTTIVILIPRMPEKDLSSICTLAARHALHPSMPQSPIPRKFPQLQIPRVHRLPFAEPNPAFRTNQQIHQLAVSLSSK
jgi:hypothetical protein